MTSLKGRQYKIFISRQGGSISVIKRKKDELQELHSVTPDLKENQVMNQNQNHGRIPDPGEEYLFPYWDEYWDESDK